MPPEGRGLRSRGTAEGGRDDGNWREPSSSGKGPETPDDVPCESEAEPGVPLLHAERQGRAGGCFEGCLAGGAPKWRDCRAGRRDPRRHRSARSGEGARGTGEGLADRRLPPASGAAGTDSQEAGGANLPVGHSVRAGSSRADGSRLGAGVDLRGRLATGTIRLPGGSQCAGRGPARASAAEHRPPGGGGRGLVQLFRRDSACRVAAELGPAHQRQAASGLAQGMAGKAVEEDTGPGGPRRTNRARRERKGTPQGAPISPLLSNLSRRRFLLGWKTLGYARRFSAEIVNYADDFVICGRAPAEAMRAAVERRMERLRLPLQAWKTRCVRVPEEPVEFLGYRVGRAYRRDTGREYLGTRPSAESVRRVCRRISELTPARDGWLDEGARVERLNRVLLGWANYYSLGQVSPAYRAIDAHTTKRLRQWLCRKHKVRVGKSVRYPNERLWQDLGLTCLKERTASFAWAKAGSRPRAQCGKTARWVRGAGRGTVVQVETEAPAEGRKPSATATPSTLDKRASPRLYRIARHHLNSNSALRGQLALRAVPWALRGPSVAPRPAWNLLLAGQRGLQADWHGTGHGRRGRVVRATSMATPPAPGFVAALPSLRDPLRSRWMRRVRLTLRPLAADPSGARRPVWINLGSPPSRYRAIRSKNVTTQVPRGC